MDILAQLFATGLLLGGIYALISIGMTLIYGSVFLINFAHGDYLMVAMYLSWILYKEWGMSPYVSILLVVPAMFILGAITYTLVVRPVLGGSQKVKVFVTFGVGIVATNAILIFFGGEEQAVDVAALNNVLQVGEVRVSYASVIAFLVSIVVAAVLYFLMNRTLFGKSIRATGQNPLAAQLVGINVNRARLVMFGLSTALLGVAGPLLMPIYSVFPTIGHDFILIMFITIVLGGLGSYKGAIVGGLLVGLIQSLGGYYLPPELQGTILFILLICILIVRPHGIYGRAKVAGTAEKSVL